jgi:hypothetical protein
MIEQIAFVLLVGGGGFFAFTKFKAIYRNIMLGRKEAIPANLKAMILVALGQGKMFKRPVAAMLARSYLRFICNHAD